MGRAAEAAMGRNAGVWGFGLVWTAFSAFWTASATLVAGAFGLLGVPFLLFGLFRLAQPFLGARAAARTLYVVTDRRAVVATPEGDGLTVRTIPPGLLRTLQITRHPDGSGTIRFDTDTPQRTNALGRYTALFAFETVPDVDGAVENLRALFEADGRGTPAAVGVPEVDLGHSDIPPEDDDSGVRNRAIRANLRGSTRA